MKQQNSISALVALLAMVCATSCNDDLDDVVKKENTAATTTSDNLCGYSNLIVKADDIRSERVGLNAGNLKIKNENPELTYTIEQDSKGYYLLPHLTGATNQFHYDKVNITTSDGSKTQNLQVVIDPATFTTRSGSEPDWKENLTEMQRKACELLGFGTDYRFELGHTNGKAFIDLTSFVQSDNKYYQDNLHNALICRNLNGNVDQYKAEGSSRTELSEQTELKMGIKVKFPVNLFNLSAGIDKNLTTTTKYTEEHNYLLANVVVNEFEASLDPKALARMVCGNDTAQINYSAILSQSANNALNNPGSSEGQGYPSTLAGMMSLIDDYGTHVVTEAQFGGSAKLCYSMMKTSSTTKIEDYCGFELGLQSAVKLSGEQEEDLSKTKEKDGKKATAKAIYKRAISPEPPSLNINISNKNTSESFSEQIHSEYKCNLTGGIVIESKDKVDEWKCSGISKLVPLTYGIASTVEKVARGEDNRSLIPIYEFCTSPERKKILQDLLTPDANGVMLYHKLKMQQQYGTQADTTVQRDSTVVVADVQLVYVEAHKLTNDLVRPLTLKDHFGNQRIYYPMVMTAEHPDTSLKNDFGRALVLNQKSCTGIDFNSENNGSILCYYALDYAFNTNGITNIRLLNNKQYADYGLRNEFCPDENYISGDRNNEKAKATRIIAGAATWYGNIGDDIRVIGGDDYCERLYITYGNADTRTEDKIKAVAWCIGDNQSKPYEGHIIGASGGAEWGTSNNFTDSEQKDFKTYWHTKGSVHVNVNGSAEFVKYEKRKFLWYWSECERKYNEFPVYSKENLMRSMKPVSASGSNRKEFPIVHPIAYN